MITVICLSLVQIVHVYLRWSKPESARQKRFGIFFAVNVARWELIGVTKIRVWLRWSIRLFATWISCPPPKVVHSYCVAIIAFGSDTRALKQFWQSSSPCNTSTKYSDPCAKRFLSKRNYVLEAVRTEIDPTGRKCSHSFRSISVRTRAFTFRSLFT